MKHCHKILHVIKEKGCRWVATFHINIRLPDVQNFVRSFIPTPLRKRQRTGWHVHSLDNLPQQSADHATQFCAPTVSSYGTPTSLVLRCIWVRRSNPRCCRCRQWQNPRSSVRLQFSPSGLVSASRRSAGRISCTTRSARHTKFRCVDLDHLSRFMRNKLCKTTGKTLSLPGCRVKPSQQVAVESRSGSTVFVSHQRVGTKISINVVQWTVSIKVCRVRLSSGGIFVAMGWQTVSLSCWNLNWQTRSQIGTAQHWNLINHVNLHPCTFQSAHPVWKYLRKGPQTNCFWHRSSTLTGRCKHGEPVIK